MTETYPETALEKMFQKVEEESERRAQRTHSVEYNRDRELVPSGSATMRPPRERRRGSISISRFGQLPDPLTPKDANGPPTPTLLSIIASRATFYQADVANASVNSFASAGSTQMNDDEDDVHVTQVQQIVGRRQSISKAVGNMLPRRISRARSVNVMCPSPTSDTNVVIGVSVEEAIIDAPEEAAEATGHGRATVYALGALRSRASTFTMGYSRTSPEKGWLTKAKGLTEKIRRKSQSREAVE